MNTSSIKNNRNAKIGKECLSLRIEKNIRRFEITMNDIAFVSMLERLTNLRKNSERFFKRKRLPSTLAKAILKGASDCVLRNKIGNIILYPSIIEGKAVVMPQLFEDLS